MALAGLELIGALLRLLPERDPHEDLFEALIAMVEASTTPPRAGGTRAIRGADAAGMRVRARFLGLRGDRRDEDLVYVSPKSGRAVSAAAGAPYRDRLLPLPAFLREGGGEPTFEEIADAFRLTGFFLERELFAPRGLKLPDARERSSARCGARADARCGLRLDRFARQ